MYQLFHNFKIFLYLGRYNKPNGAFLLMWPCFWGVIYSESSSQSTIELLILFFFGSFFMRGAGCTINDILDVKYDLKVKRTKGRPLPSNKISKKNALIFLIIQLLLGLAVLVNFNKYSIIFSLLIMPLVLTYPLFKRITFFPQIILGIVFNWGIIIGFISTDQNINIGIIYLYLAGVFKTIGYDTIYAFQDLLDDQKVGVKSLAIKIQTKPKFFLSIIYLISLIFFFLAMTFKIGFFLNLLFSSIILTHFYFQITKLDINNPSTLYKSFSSNTNLGCIIFILLFLVNKFHL